MVKYFLGRINWIDILFIIVLIRTTYIGFRKGLGLEIFKFLGMIAALILSFHYFERVGRYITNHSFLPESISNFFAFTTLIIIVIFGFKLIGLLVRSFMKIEFAQPMEKAGGALLGMGRGVVIGSIMLFVLVNLPSDYLRASINEKSLSGPILLRVGPGIYKKAIHLVPYIGAENRPKKDTSP